MAHSYGFSNLVLPLLLHGIPLVIGDAPLPERLKRAAAEFSAVTLPGVPALWRTWADAAAIPSNVRLAISAGAPLPLRLEEEIFSREGIKVHNFYGSSECGGIAYDRTEKPRPDPALVGTALEGVKVKVDGDGCLMVESEAVGLGYWPAPEPALGSGRFITSDLARIDGDRIFLEGRRNDLINVAGRKISPEAIERVLSGCDGVRDCVVFGVAESREERFERVVAAVALADGASLDGVKQFAQERLATWQWPKEWWVATEPLQTNSRGKRARADVREQYLATGRQRKM